MARTYESLLDYAYSSDRWPELLLSVMEEHADTAGPYQNCPHPTRPRLMEPPPPTPMPSLSHCGSLSPKNHTPSLPSDVHTCSLYKASPHPHPHFSVSGASVHNDTVSFLERVYCAARVYTNVVLQFGAHNTRDREIIKHCTGKKTKKTKE